jgi:mannose-6-phosphate isomerase-like protein (cupin superfamily)
LVNIEKIVKKNLKLMLNEVEIKPSSLAMDNVCTTKKICDAQGQITFGQLREIVEKGKIKRLGVQMGEGLYKSTLRLVPWFIPQLVLAGFGATWVRVFNKLFRPTLMETTSYKTWWGKTILRIFNMVEGELNASDPLSKIFFISDGLMTMLDEKTKVKFAHYISELANEKPNDEIVPNYFVENQLRYWLNKKYFLDPPLPPKKDKNNDLPFVEKIEEGFKYRTFKSNTDSQELKWHFDKKDRKVTILEGNGWKLQLDNKIPITLKEGDVVFIPKGEYHRVIKGEGDLKIKIFEYL